MKKIATIIVIVLFVTKVEAQVNLQTGSANYSLPMFNWKDNKSRLTSIVALNYSSGNGLRVNDVASNVGQGWNLIAGGVITRMQVGEPDDQKAFGGNQGGGDHDITKYPAGYLYATVPAFNGCPQVLTKYPIYSSMNQLYTQHNVTAEDKQLDYFSFQFNGKSGMFVLDTVNGDNGKPLGDTKLKISFQRDTTMKNQGIRTTITSFIIQDVDGIMYKFRQHGLTKVLHAGFCDTTLSNELNQPNFKQMGIYHQTGFDNNQLVNPYVIGSWYLSEIVDPLTQRTIVFSYINNSNDNISGIDITDNRTTTQSYFVISHKRSVTITPDLSSVSYPDGHQVQINYGNLRADFVGEKVIASVDILYQGRYLSKYLLNTTYFILNHYGTPITTYQKSVARLCLKSVKKVGVDLKEDTPPYVFDYYLGSDIVDDFVPPPFFYAKDIFGFYNGNNSVDYNGGSIPIQNKTIAQLNFDQLRGLCFLTASNDVVYPNAPTPVYVNPKSGYAKNGLLKQIIYPTGGTLTYTYSQNKGNALAGSVTYNPSSVGMIGGVSVSQTSSTDGGYSNGCANPIVTNYNYVLSDQTTSSIWGLEKPVNAMLINSHYQPEWKSYRWPPAPFGKCYWHFQYPGIMSQQQAINLSGAQTFMNANETALDILSVFSSIQDVSALVAGASGGTFSFVTAIVDVVVNIALVGFTCIGNNAKDYATTVYYNSDLNGASPLPAQYKRVEVVEGSGSIGKTVQEFTSSDDYAVWVPANSNTTFSFKQRFAPWSYGLPKLTTVYDVTGNIIKQTKNVYDFSKAQQLIDLVTGKIGYSNPSGLQTPLVSCKCAVNKMYSQRDVDWSKPTEYTAPTGVYLTSSATNGDLNVDFYGMYTGRVELDTTYERVFKTTDATQYVETVTAYGYNSYYNFDVNQVTTIQSNGDINYKNIFYNSDYNTGVLATLVQNNIFSETVATTTSLSKAGGSTPLQFLSEHVTEFATLSNGDIKPYRTLEQRVSQPTTYSSMSFYKGPNNINNPSYKQTQLFTYDASSNLIGLQDEGNHTVNNIYDYNDKYVVASIINADPLLDHSAYTSFETNSLGGWTLNGTAASNATSSVTGNNSFVLSASNSLSATLNTTKTYTISFWATNNTVSVSGASLSKSAPTINGYTYYEYNAVIGTTSVSISGNANIDELRLYPNNARMRTVTYDPLIGKTSECDENNRITYYQYDNLGRLRFIQDEYKNVLKMYEYNNVSVSKQNGCPSIYYNHQVTEYFKKSNCVGGYLGTDVSYTVPAARYSSTISQADADAKAENDLNTNGQVQANNIGSCTLIYYNVSQSRTLSTQSCADGSVGGNVTYTVPANRYLSILSQADADQKATDELDANAQAYANSSAHAACSVNTNAIWETDSIPQVQCGTGTQAGHMLGFAHDINPNSTTFNTTQWMDMGPDSSCSLPQIPVVGSSTIANATFQVTLTNTSTGNVYANAIHYSNPIVASTLFNAPAGTYNVSVYPLAGYTGSYVFQIGTYLYTVSAGGNPLSITGVTILINTDAIILIDPVGQAR